MLRRLWRELGIASNWPVLAAGTILSFLGVCSIWAHSQIDGTKQLIFLAVGLGCMGLFQTVNYQIIGRWAWGFYVVSLLLVLDTVIGATRGGHNPLPFVHPVNSAYAWISFGPATLQPAELTKIAFVLVLGRFLRFRSNYRTITGLLAPFGLALVPLALIMKQPDLGTALTFIPALFAMLFVAGARMWHLLAIVALGVATTPLLWFCG